MAVGRGHHFRPRSACKSRHPWPSTGVRRIGAWLEVDISRFTQVNRDPA